MKRILAVLLLIALLLVTVACGDTEKKPEKTGSVTEALTQATPKTPTLADFDIVCAKDAALNLQNEVDGFLDFYKNLSGSELKVKNEEDASSDFEIVIGNTRAEAADILVNLQLDAYAVKAVKTAAGLKVIVVGGCVRSEIFALQALQALLTEKGGEAMLTADIKGNTRITMPQKISFFGDSITTYQGVSNFGMYNSTLVGNKVWYSADRLARNQTWWSIVLSELDAKLCVNNSYSGDWAGSDVVMERAKNLHKDVQGTETPDTIVVYFGINDRGKNNASFEGNYRQMMQIMRETYPEARIFCCTLLDCGYGYAGESLVPYNAAIKSVANEVGATVIDLQALIGTEYFNGLSELTFDELHPNAEGMRLIGNAVSSEIEKWVKGE